MLLFAALGALYYFKERNRLFREQKVKHRLEYAECEHLQKLLGNAKECAMAPIETIDGLEQVYRELAIALGLAVLLVVPTGYYLARLSLRPVREAIETIDTFINGIVHDVNTPLSIIKLNAQSMRPQLDSERLRARNDRILQGIADIESLEEQLSFSLRADRYVPALQSYDLQAMLQARLPYWRDLRASVRVALQDEAMMIRADRALLTRMIDNLVSNAVKFSHRDGEVTVRLQRGVLCVEDHGIGIRHPEAVFAKYYREDHGIKGLGLGLYITYSIARLHGVTLAVQSRVGAGTTFRVDLQPLAEAVS